MPIRGLLKCPSCLQHGDVVSGTRNKLNSYWQVLFRESARHGESRKAAKVADSSQRVGKRESRKQIQIQRCSRDGLRGSYKNIVGVKESTHF